MVFCREDCIQLDRWQVRREFAVITRAAGLGEQWAPRELRHLFVSILSAHGVRIKDISDLVGHSGTSVTESVYRHEIRPALTIGATGMNKTSARSGPDRLSPSRNGTKKHQPGWPPSGSRRSKRVPDQDPEPFLTC